MNLKSDSLDLNKVGFLKFFNLLFDKSIVKHYDNNDHNNSTVFSRASCDGVILIKGKVNDRTVGIIYNDFRIQGGSFSHQGSKKIINFLEEAILEKTPVVFFLNTLGVRFTEGRTIFTDAFSILPTLKKFTDSNLLITCILGRCLGIGAIIFRFGHYRLGIKEKGFLNLTGSEVINLFFGEKIDFDKIAALENKIKQTDLVHEILDNREDILKRIKNILEFYFYSDTKTFDNLENIIFQKKKAANKYERKCLFFLEQIGKIYIEVFQEFSSIVRTFIVIRGNNVIGVFSNTPGRPDNMIDVQTIQKYSAAISLFKAMKLPVISLIDTPGADPRSEFQGLDIIGAMFSVTEQIIEYPYEMMGISVGRCYGGASIFGFPFIFGQNKQGVAVRGSKIGIMDEKIISHIVSGSPKLASEWKKSLITQTEDLQDLVDCGLVKYIIEENEVGQCVDRFLFKTYL